MRVANPVRWFCAAILLAGGACVDFDLGPICQLSESGCEGSVTVSPATVSIAIGATVQLKATVKNAAGAILPSAPIIWESSNRALVVVSESGGPDASGRRWALVAGVGAGAATITASRSSGQFGER